MSVTKTIWCTIAPNTTTYIMIPQIAKPCTNFFLKYTPKNLPERRERKVCDSVFGCFSRSLINAVREAKELSTLLLISANLASAGFALTPFWHFKHTLQKYVKFVKVPFDNADTKPEGAYFAV